MNKIKFLIPLFLIFCVNAYSQVITGKIYNSTTRLPVADAYVYLNGSSYFTTTNESGEFYLNVPKKMNTQLVISCMSYETLAIDDPFEEKTIEASLIEKENVLSEVVVKANRFSRQQLLKAFELQFLGDDKAGRSCIILNKDDIQLYFDEEEKTLYATNERPIIVENKYLGYQMHCFLSEFKVRYSYMSLNAGMETAVLRANIFFVDMAPNNPVIKKQRDEAYKGSLSYFFKNLANKTIRSSKHLVYNYGTRYLVDPYKYFDVTDNELQKTIRIKPNTDINTFTKREFPYPVFGIINIEYPAKRYSEIYFLTDEFSVDAFGLIDKKDHVFLSGQMDQRIGNTLPLEYEITSTICEQNNIQDIPDRLVSLFENQLKIFPQEKIHVHTDKPYYISGEKIRFRAYLADAKSHAPVAVSRYVYAELINSFNTVVARVKIRQEESAYHGYLPIPEDALEGNYTMRAYTAFMQNQDENYFFTKTIYIGDPQAGAVHQASKPNDDFDVSFYPEGGSLMQGTFCKVAFKAMKSNGLTTDISGKVYDQTGKEIKEFKSEHLGMGSFPFLAEKGKTYYAICKNDKGKTKRFDLPVAVDYGYALSVNKVKDKMYVSVLKPAETTQNDELYLLAHTRGMVHFADRWHYGKNHLIQQDQFPSGVLHLILFDSGSNPVSERLVFINNQDQAQISYLPDQENYNTRSLVKNRVTLTDSGGQPLVGSFSVAVTSDREVKPDSTSNILTELLLTSDLRGNIENPAYYFQNTTVSALALDLLMCTQGWRRYNIAELAQGNFSRPMSPVEVTPEISGIVKNDLLGTPAKNMEIVIMSLKNDYFNKTQTDKNGRFSFREIEWPDSAAFTISVKMKKTTTAKNLIIDKENFPERTLRALPLARIDNDLFTKYVDKADQHYIYEHGMRTINLPEVRVTAKKKPLKKSPYYDMPTYTLTGDIINRFSGAPNILWLLNLAPGVHVDFNTKKVRFMRNFGFGAKAPCLIVDNMIWEMEAGGESMIDMINVSDVAQIDILSGVSAMVFGSRAAGGAIVIFTKTYEDYKDDDNNKLHIKQISPLGYQQPVEFYAPKYDTSEKRNATIPDLRTTIHWEPVVQTDNQGEASFEFYTADESTSYTVVIEGLADDRSIIRKEEKLSVKDK